MTRSEESTASDGVTAKQSDPRQDAAPKRGRGRPEKPIPIIDATPEQAARAIFSAVKKPDPSLRKLSLRQKSVHAE